MAEVFVGEADFFRAEEQGDATGSEALANEARAFLQAMNRLLRSARADGAGSHDESTIGHSFGHGFEFLRVGKHRRSANGGAGFAKRRIVRIDHAEVRKPEVTHGPSAGPNVERIARSHQNHAKAVEFSALSHAAVWIRLRETVNVIRSFAARRARPASAPSSSCNHRP